MNRRGFITRGAAALLASRAGSGDEPASRVRVIIRPNERLHTIAPDFMGLGYEISSVARPGLLSSRNRVYVQLVRTLGSHGVIRIGGNTSDFSTYSPASQPVSSAKGTVVNDSVLRDLGGFLEATGWRLIWGLNLGQGSVADAVAEAKAVLDTAGKQVLAFEIGNEPDLFPNAKHRQPGYGYDDWLAEYRRYKAALRERFPRIPLAGPDAAVRTDWVTRFAANEGKDAMLLTHHYYREGQNPTSTIEKLLAPDPKLQPQLEKLSAASRACGLPYRICEVNSFSGGGRPGVSDTFAGALWALDYLFTLAANGCSGVNMETGVNHRDFISSYSPIGDDEHGHYSAKPEYYGLLAFSVAARGSLLRTETEGGSPAVKAYATQSGRAGLVATLINKGAEACPVIVNAGGAIRKVSLIHLRAPAVSAKEGATLGGAELAPTGAWRAAEAGALQARNGEFSLDLPAASAAIVSIG